MCRGGKRRAATRTGKGKRRIGEGCNTTSSQRSRGRVVKDTRYRAGARWNGGESVGPGIHTCGGEGAEGRTEEKTKLPFAYTWRLWVELAMNGEEEQPCS
jgi:hypothetical protein